MRAGTAFGAFVAYAPATAAGGEGPLRGMRIAVKDNIGVAGFPFTAGLPMFAARLAARDAAVVKRLRDAGGTIVGVTRTDSGGLGVVAPDVTNPTQPGAIVGGSSGGSAAAVAAGFADLGLGTDTGGSVRIPAACCRLIAFKPSHGRVSYADVWPLAPELEDVGVIAASVAALTAAVGALLGTRVVAEVTPAPIRIGVDFERAASCAPEVALSFQRSIRRIQSAGGEIRNVRLPSRHAVARAHCVLVLSAARELYRDSWSSGDREGLGATLSRALQAADRLGATDIAAARRTKETTQEWWHSMIESVDCIATPTLAVTVPSRDVRRVRLEGQDMPLVLALTAETCLANLLGVPAVAMPPAYETESMQLMARAGDDEALLRNASRIMAMMEGH